MGQSVSRGFSGAQIFSTYGALIESSQPLISGSINIYGDIWASIDNDYAQDIHISCYNTDFPSAIAVYTGPGTDFETLTEVAFSVSGAMNGIQYRHLKISAEYDTLYFVTIGSTNSNVTSSVIWEIVKDLDTPKIISSGFNSNNNFQLYLQCQNQNVSGSCKLFSAESINGPWSECATVAFTGSASTVYTDTSTLVSKKFYRTLYSETIVGYCNRNLSQGWNMVGNPFFGFSGSDIEINQRINVQSSSCVWFKFNNEQNNIYTPSSTHYVQSGIGLWASASVQTNIQFHGVVGISYSNTIGSTQEMIGVAIPSSSLTIPSVEGTSVYTWNSSTQQYVNNTFEFGQWTLGSAPVIEIGEGCLISSDTGFTLTN